MQDVRPILILLAVVACGQGHNAGSELLVVGGSPVGASDATVSATVALLRNGQSHCSGTLIGENQIVTAAHCVSGVSASSLSVGAGTTGKAVAGLKVTGVKAHSGYSTNASKGANDIGVVVFSGTVPSTYKPAAIATIEEAKAGTSVVVAGYGVTGETKKDAGTLRSVTTTIGQVNATGREVSLATGTKKGACYGDSGGPTYVPVGGELKALGATSRGSNCDTGNGIMTDVRRYKSWLTCTTKALGNELEGLEADESAADCEGGAGASATGATAGGGDAGIGDAGGGDADAATVGENGETKRPRGGRFPRRPRR